MWVYVVGWILCEGWYSVDINPVDRRNIRTAQLHCATAVLVDQRWHHTATSGAGSIVVYWRVRGETDLRCLWRGWTCSGNLYHMLKWTSDLIDACYRYSKMFFKEIMGCICQGCSYIKVLKRWFQTYYYALSINCENHRSPCELWKTNSLVLF